MKIIIKTKNLESSQSLNDFVEKKFLVLKKFFKKDDSAVETKTLAEVFVEIEKETNHHRKGDIFVVKAQVAFPGTVIMAGEIGSDLFAAIVATRDEMKQEIEKFKAKKVDKNRRTQRKAKREIIK